MEFKSASPGSTLTRLGASSAASGHLALHAPGMHLTCCARWLQGEMVDMLHVAGM